MATVLEQLEQRLLTPKPEPIVTHDPAVIKSLETGLADSPPPQTDPFVVKTLEDKLLSQPHSSVSTGASTGVSPGQSPYKSPVFAKESGLPKVSTGLEGGLSNKPVYDDFGYGVGGSWDEPDPHTTRMTGMKDAYVEEILKMSPNKRRAWMGAHANDEFFGLNEWMSRKNIHPTEWLQYLFDGVDVRGFNAAEKAAIEKVVSESPLKEKVIQGAASVPRLAVEFGATGMGLGALAKTAGLGSKISGSAPLVDRALSSAGKAAAVFGAHEGMQAPRKDETIPGRVASTVGAAGTGVMLGALGAAVPSTAIRAPAVIAGFGGKTYMETGGDVDATIEAMVQIAAFEALGLSKQAARYGKSRYESYRAGDKLAVAEAVKRTSADLFRMRSKALEELGLGPEATSEQIRQAKRQAGMKLHPDIAGKQAEPAFKQKIAAAEFLEGKRGQFVPETAKIRPFPAQGLTKTKKTTPSTSLATKSTTEQARAPEAKTVFSRMPDDILKQQADHGVLGAQKEQVLRQSGPKAVESQKKPGKPPKPSFKQKIEPEQTTVQEPASQVAPTRQPGPQEPMEPVGEKAGTKELAKAEKTQIAKEANLKQKDISPAKEKQQLAEKTGETIKPEVVTPDAKEIVPIKTHRVTIEGTTQIAKKLFVRKQLQNIIKTLPEKTTTEHQNLLNELAKRDVRRAWVETGDEKDKIKKLTALLRSHSVKVEFDNDTTLWIPNSRDVIDRDPKWINKSVGAVIATSAKPRKKITLPVARKKTKISSPQLKAGKDYVKLVHIAAASKVTEKGQSLSGVKATEDEIVATDGRILFTIKREGAFKDVAQVYKDNKGMFLGKDGKPITNENLSFPTHEKVIPEDNLITTETDLQQLFRNIKKASLFAGKAKDPEKEGVHAYLNPDKTLGFTCLEPSTTSKVNVQDGASYVASMNPHNLMRLITAHIKVGSKKLKIHIKEGENNFGVLKLVGEKGDTSVIIGPFGEKEYGDIYNKSEAGFAAIPDWNDAKEFMSLPHKTAKGIASLGGRFTQQSVDQLAKWAPISGKALGDSFFTITHRESELVGLWMDEMRNAMGKMTKAEQDNYRRAVRGNATATNKKVKTAIDLTLKLSDKMGVLKEDVGLSSYGPKGETPFKLLQKQYPLRLSKQARESIQKESGKEYEDLAEWIALDMDKRGIEYVEKQIREKTKNRSKATYIKQAKRFLRDSRKYSPSGQELEELYLRLSQGKKTGPRFESKIAKWQYHRAFEYPDMFLDKNPYKVWEQHIYSSGRRIAEAEVWGPKSDRLKKTIKAGYVETGKIARKKGKDIDREQQSFLDAASHLVGYESDIGGLKTQPSKVSVKMMRGGRIATGAIHLFNLTAPLRNTIWGQAASMTHFGSLMPHAQYLRVIFQPKSIKEARKAGALEHSGTNHFFAEGVAPEIVSVARLPMGIAEIMLRTTSAFTGAGVWSRAVKRANKKYKKTGKIHKDNWLIRELTNRDVGFTKEQCIDMIKRGSVSTAERYRMMRGAVNVTQFSADAKDIPLSWSTEGGRFWTQFYSMAYKHTQNTIGYALEELGHVRLKPLLRFAIAAIFAGWSIEKVREVFSGKMPGKKDVDRLDKWLRRIGNALGVIEVPIRLLSTSDPGQVLRTITPAPVGTAANLVAAAHKAAATYAGPEATTEKKQQKKEASAIKGVATTTGLGRNIYGILQKARQGRPLLGIQAVSEKEDTVAEYYRRKLANLYRESKPESEIKKHDDWARKKGINIKKEKEKAQITVRSELYDELYMAKKKEDSVKYDAINERLKTQLGTKSSNIRQAIENRTANDEDRKPRKVGGSSRRNRRSRARRSR